MTRNHRTADVESVQEVLREIVERVLQEILEAQMTDDPAHWSSAL